MNKDWNKEVLLHCYRNRALNVSGPLLCVQAGGWRLLFFTSEPHLTKHHKWSWPSMQHVFQTLLLTFEWLIQWDHLRIKHRDACYDRNLPEQSLWHFTEKGPGMCNTCDLELVKYFLFNFNQIFGSSFVSLLKTGEIRDLKLFWMTVLRSNLFQMWSGTIPVTSPRF